MFGNANPSPAFFLVMLHVTSLSDIFNYGVFLRLNNYVSSKKIHQPHFLDWTLKWFDLIYCYLYSLPWCYWGKWERWGDTVVVKSIKHWWRVEGDGPTAVKMMGRRVYSDVQGSEICVIGTSCLLVTYLLNWPAKRWEGEHKWWRIGRGVRARTESRKRRSTESIVLELEHKLIGIKH